MNKRLDIDTLRTLKAIQETGGVSRAAENLSVSQSAVSHKIRRLETSLDCQLLNRKPGQPLFTGDGRKLLEYANRIVAIHDEALAGLNRPHLNGRIRLGITEELVSLRLARVLGQFARLFPDVQVSSTVEQSLVLEDKLQNGEIDLAVMQDFKHRVETGPDCVQLHEEQLVWVRSHDLDLPASGPLPFVAFDQHCFYRAWAEKALQKSPYSLNIVLVCASNNGVCNAVSAGMGFALIARRNLRPDMQIIESTLPSPPDIVFLLRTSGSQVPAHVTTLREQIVDAYREAAPVG